MDYNRAGEQGAVPLRRDRFFHTDAGWFFSTREGAPIGPFKDRREAQNGLSDFLEFLELAEPHTLSQFYAALAS